MWRGPHDQLTDTDLFLLQGIVSVENENLTGAVRFIQQEVDAHRATFNPEQPRDFIDLYLLSEGSESEDKEKSREYRQPVHYMDNLLHAQVSVGWNYLSGPILQRCNHWYLGTGY